MLRIIGFFVENIRRISTTILFIVTILLVVYFYPKEMRFKFEYQKGKPWLHKTLTAPFDFPINKTDKDVQFEKDSITRNSPLYFVSDNDVYNSKLEEFKLGFEEKWTNLLNKDSSKIFELEKTDEDLKLNLFSFCNALLNTVYNEPGILELPDSLNKLKLENKSIFVLKNNVEEEFLFATFYNQTTAINYLNKTLNNYVSKNYILNNTISEFLKSLFLSKYVIPNTNFDNATTMSVREQLVNSISTSRGMVSVGEKIIDNGEIVNNEKFNILESLRKEYEQANYNPSLIFGQTLVVFICMLMVYLFLLNFRSEVLVHFKKTIFILTTIIIFVIVSRVALSYNMLSVYLIPYTLLPIIIRAFYDSRLALFIHNVTMIMIGFFMPNSFEFILLQIIAGMVAIFSLANVRRRGQLFMSAIFIFLTYCVIYFGIVVVQEGNLNNFRLRDFSWFAGNGIMVLAAYPLIYIFEKIFGFLSDVSLMELADTNQKLLRSLAEKAPGTFQHSLQVANLAEEVIIKIGGNSLLIRAGALYHDIGKMSLPHFYIENQSQGTNPHDEIDIEKSAEIITGHVPYGIDTARKYRIPEQIIDFIRTHHGNTKVQYFYKTFIKKFPETEIDLQKFVYKGQPPTTKETAVLMMADAIEASARTLKIYSEKTINELVEKIVSYQMLEKQFDNADITLKEISEAKEIFKKKIKNIYHSRIEYPK